MRKHVGGLGVIYTPNTMGRPQCSEIFSDSYMSTCYGTEYKALHGMAPDYLSNQLSVCQRGRCSRFSPVCGARRPHRPERAATKVRRQSIRHLRSSDVEQFANDSQKFQHLVKLQIYFEVSLVYLTILEAAPTVMICDGALESVLRVMAPLKLSSYYYYYYYYFISNVERLYSAF